MNTNEIKSAVWFAENLWNELNRFNGSGILVETVTCTEENMFNLHDSQYSEKSKYGEIYRYSLCLDESI